MTEFLSPKHDGFEALCNVMGGPCRDRNELEYAASLRIKQLESNLTAMKGRMRALVKHAAGVTNAIKSISQGQVPVIWPIMEKSL